MYVIQLMKTSDKKLFYTNHWEIYYDMDNRSYSLVYPDIDSNYTISFNVTQ